MEWGYYFDEAPARQVIEGDISDISEHDYYHFGILSRLEEGALAVPVRLQWYEFIWKDGKFLRADKIARPEQYRHLA